MASVISAWTVAWRPGLFHRTWMSKASSSRAFRSGGRPSRMSPARGSSSSRAGSAARGVLRQHVWLFGATPSSWAMGDPGRWDHWQDARF